MKIALVPMSAKPYHVGHDKLVRIAARECDEVRLFVSTSDRARPGEFVVTGEAMEKVWKEHIKPSLPDNVYVEYGGSPVRKVWNDLGEANEFSDPDDYDTYVVYSDPTDLADNFPEEKIRMYAGNIYDAGCVELRPVDRASTAVVSGADVRRCLASGDRNNFVRMMPAAIDGDAVWDILQSA